MKITNFYVMDGNGEEISADPHGNNLAIMCSICRHPVLLTAHKNQRGSDEDHPATCKGCGRKYFLDIRGYKEMLYVHAVVP